MTTTTTRRAPARAARPPGRRRRPSRLWRWRRPIFVVVLLGSAAAAGGLLYLSRLKLPNPHPQDQTSYVYAADGQLLARYQVEDRTDVGLSQVPPIVIDAVLSTEDRHFFHEGAINPISIGRAVLHDLFGGAGLQGGSTITQQYVKQAYLTPQRTLLRKIKEAFIAIKLDQELSKDQILQDYLNTIYLGRGAYGIQAAAQAYFGMNVSQLRLPEAALLAGLIREPDVADPAADPAVARQNQDDTLAAMVRDHQITRAQAAAVEALPFSRYVKPLRFDATAGLASVAGDQYYLAAVHAQLVATYGAAEVAEGGLRVTTTLDPTLQQEAYNAVYGTGPNALNPAGGDPSGALVSVDGRGRVVALVGGQDYATSQVDLALGVGGGGSGRQAGSTFKAFMLAELIKQGYSVESTFPAPPELVIPGGNAGGGPWVVGNFEGEAGSTSESVVQATALSLNTVYAQIVDRLGPASLDAMAESVGIPSAALGGAYLSTVLGTADVSPLGMAAAYATFADGGVYRSPVLISRVTDASGKPLPLPTQVIRRVLTPAQAAVEDYVLQQVVAAGTGEAAGGIGAPVAGKTGTTDSSDDAWFIGFTPGGLTTAVWMGYANAEAPMVDFRGYASIQGGTIPAAIWHDAMTAMLQTDPQYGGVFSPVTSLYGTVLTPPTGLGFPEGLGTTTTTAPPSTTTTLKKKKGATTTTTTTTAGSASTTVTSVPTATTTSPSSTTTTAPATTTTPTTAPPTTAPTTTAPPTTVKG